MVCVGERSCGFILFRSDSHYVSNVCAQEREQWLVKWMLRPGSIYPHRLFKCLVACHSYDSVLFIYMTVFYGDVY